MKLFLVRHGRSNYNELELCNDDPNDDVHLTTLGIFQAEQVGQTLKNAPLQRIYSSPLPRAMQTAAIIDRHHRLSVIPHPGLHDIRTGFNGKPVRDYFAAIAHSPLTACPPGGESLLDYKSRILATIGHLTGQPEATILAVAHEETLRIVYSWYHDLADKDLRNLHFANGTILEFDLFP
ncbi:MAG: histidine phosphatase family protein [Magnetococcales bacterium]|nr:histidine phosphatase family protein [Magnetococcales bacterium]